VLFRSKPSPLIIRVHSRDSRGFVKSSRNPMISAYSSADVAAVATESGFIRVGNSLTLRKKLATGTGEIRGWAGCEHRGGRDGRAWAGAVQHNALEHGALLRRFGNR